MSERYNPMTDKKTTDYFNKEAHEYSAGRFDFSVDFLNRHARKGSTLADVGCGNGNVLEYLLRATPIEHVVAIDASDRYIEQVRERLQCPAICCSILDYMFGHVIDRQFDFVVMGALLYHLVGKTRKASWMNAQRSVRNALSIVRSGGYLLIHEPVFYPSYVMTAVFWLKRIVSSFFSGRISIMGHWNNIGEPVVSYYTNEKLRYFLASLSDAQLMEEDVVEASLSTVMRLIGISRKTNSTFVLKKI